MPFAEILYKIQKYPGYFASAALTVAGLALSACGGNPAAYAQLPTRTAASVPMPPFEVEQVGGSGDPENYDEWLQELERKRAILNAQTEHTRPGDLFFDVNKAFGPKGNEGKDIIASINGYISELRTLSNTQDEEWLVERTFETIASSEGIVQEVLKISIQEKSSGDDEIYETYEVLVVEDDTDPDIIENTSFITRSQFIDEMLPKLRERTGLEFDDLSDLIDSESLKKFAIIAQNPSAYLASRDLSIADTKLQISPDGILSMQIVTADGLVLFVKIEKDGSEAYEEAAILQFELPKPEQEEYPQPDLGQQA